MEKIGYVIAESNGKVILDLKRTGSCGDKCNTCKSHCEIPSVQVEMDNVLNVKRGDFVEVGMNTTELVKSAFIIYTIPLIMFILGISISVKVLQARGIINYEIYSLVIGLFVLAITFSAIRFFTNHSSESQSSILHMKKVL